MQTRKRKYNYTNLPDGKKSRLTIDGPEAWFLNDQPHRLDAPARIWPDGSFAWLEFGKLHRNSGSGPAQYIVGYVQRWYVRGQPHRIGGPAEEYADGRKTWYVRGILHRVGGPALEDSDGSKHWCEKGVRHRIGGPAVERANGTGEWYEKGRRHRVGGPAIERANGDYFWYLSGGLHRFDGPAVKSYNWFISRVQFEFYLHGRLYSPQHFYNIRWVYRRYFYRLRRARQIRIKQQLYKDTALPLVLCEMVAAYA